MIKKFLALSIAIAVLSFPFTAVTSSSASDSNEKAGAWSLDDRNPENFFVHYWGYNSKRAPDRTYQKPSSFEIDLTEREVLVNDQVIPFHVGETRKPITISKGFKDKVLDRVYRENGVIYLQFTDTSKLKFNKAKVKIIPRRTGIVVLYKYPSRGEGNPKKRIFLKAPWM